MFMLVGQQMIAPHLGSVDLCYILMIPKVYQKRAKFLETLTVAARRHKYQIRSLASVP